MRLPRGSILVITLIVACVANAASASNYPLEVINLRPAGVERMPAMHRIYRAYPGLEYNVRAAVIGGVYPYTFSLANAPAGMTVDARGTIVWPDPQTDATPTLRVRDSAGSEVSAIWTVDVTRNGFRFVDAARGNDSSPGTLGEPWRTFAGIHANGVAGQVVYWRTGSYELAGVPVERKDHALGEEHIVWEGPERPVVWLAYPGERPVLDFGYTGNGAPYDRGQSVPRLKITGPGIYVDGLTFRRSMTMAFQVYHGAMAGTTFRRNVFDTTGPGIDGGNSAFIMFVAASGQNSLHTVVQDNEFSGVKNGTANSALKLYSLTKALFEDNLFRDCDTAAEGLAIKAAIVQYTVRGNRFQNVGHGIGGNMDSMGRDVTHGEILYNTVHATGEQSDALHFNQNGTAGETFIYRNTLIGSVVARGVGLGDGPFRLWNNIIVNDDQGTPSGSHVTHRDVTAPQGIVLTDNLVGRARNRIVDAAGLLTPAHAKYLGTHGSQRHSAAPPVPTGPSRTPPSDYFPR